MPAYQNEPQAAAIACATERARAAARVFLRDRATSKRGGYCGCAKERSPSAISTMPIGRGNPKRRQYCACAAERAQRGGNSAPARQSDPAAARLCLCDKAPRMGRQYQACPAERQSDHQAVATRQKCGRAKPKRWQYSACTTARTLSGAQNNAWAAESPKRRQ